MNTTPAAKDSRRSKFSPEVPLISIVDDDESVREALKSLIDSVGFRAELFRSGEEFLNSAYLSETACLITDVRMPGMPGESSPTSMPGLPGESGDSSSGESGDSSSSGSGESGSSEKGGGKSGSATPEGPDGGAQTSEERRKAGEKSLDDSLGDFDKTLKKEQERVAKERDAKGTAEGEGEGEGDGSDGSGAESGGGAPGTRSGDLKSANSSTTASPSFPQSTWSSAGCIAPS